MRIDKLLAEIRACTHCHDLLLGPRPVLNFSSNSKILGMIQVVIAIFQRLLAD